MGLQISVGTRERQFSITCKIPLHCSVAFDTVGSDLRGIFHITEKWASCILAPSWTVNSSILWWG